MNEPSDRLRSAIGNRYAIERELGQGGMATVYLAHDVRHDRKVALKILRPELAAAIGVDRFLQEIRTTANLQHPHIVPLFDSGDADGFLYYVMPYVEGESLEARLRRERQLPIDDAVRIAAGVAEALDYAHRQGVIHRDIKPANVLLRDGTPMVADFGIALAVGAAGGSRLTETGFTLGTPFYMSPEQATGDQRIGPPTDIYALGCVLYEMLVGEPPHTGSTPQAILAKIIDGEVTSAAAERPSVPGNLDAVIRKALEMLPADRFPRAQDFAKALADKDFRHGTEGRPTAAHRERLWNPLSLVTTASTLLLAMALGWSFLRPDRPSPVDRVAVQAPQGQSYDGSVALSRDGSVLVYGAVDPEYQMSALWVRRWNSLEAKPLAGTEGGAIFPAISPDGREVAFNAAGEVRVASVNGGEFRSLTRGTLLSGAAWSDDGAWIYFAESFSGLKRVPARGGPVETVAPLDSAAGDLAYASVEALPHDKGLVFAMATSDGPKIGTVDLETGRVKRLVVGTTPHYSSTGHLLFLDAGGRLLAAAFDAAKLELTGAAVPVVEGLAMATPP